MKEKPMSVMAQVIVTVFIIAIGLGLVFAVVGWAFGWPVYITGFLGGAVVGGVSAYVLRKRLAKT